MTQYLQPDTFGLNPLFEYLNTLDTKDTQQVYEIGVKIGDILLDKYHKKGQTIQSIDQLFDHTLELCRLIHQHAPHFYQCVLQCQQHNLSTIQTDKKKKPTHIENDELHTKEELRWITLHNLLTKSN